jgi:large subunit ribosomal protein L38e
VWIKLPKEIFSEEKFLELADFAIHCRVKRVKNEVKLKLRTRKHLYTYKTDPNSADRLLSSISCDVIEL